LLAQERFGGISGTVFDASGAVLPNVAVRVTNRDTGRLAETETGIGGTYAFRDLAPGRYRIRFSLHGFADIELADVPLRLGQTLRANAPMAIAANEQSVQVRATPPPLDVTSSALATNVASEEFERLPKARSFQNLALLSPSVNTGVLEGGIQVNGASGAENNFTIDGITTNSLVNGQSRQDAVFEILQEVQIKTSGIPAEYGGALGGVISAVTRSGGNAFHGDVHYYLGGNRLSAAPPPRLLLSPADQVSTNYWQDEKQNNDQHEFGYALGGYLVKNRLYFFSAGSPRMVRRTNRYLFSNGLEPDSMDQRTLHNMAFEKVSFDLQKNLRGNAFFLWTPTTSTGRLPGYNGDCANCLVVSQTAAQVNRQIGYFQAQSNYGADLTWTITPTTLFSIKAGRFWDNFRDTGLPNVTPVSYQTSATTLPFPIPAELRLPQNTNNVPRIQQSFYDIATRTYVQADVAKFLRFAGTHDFKAGAGQQKIVNRVLTGYPTGGYISVVWDRAFNSLVPGTPRNQRGPYGYYEYHEAGTSGSTGGNLANIYLQDNWRIHSRLTLTLGARIETETVPSFQRDVQDYAFRFGWLDKLAPRAGASFDVFGDGRMKVFGSWGRFYDWVKYDLARGTFGGDYWRVRYFALESPNVFALNSKNLPGAPLWNPSQPAAFRNLRVPGFHAVDPKIRPMGTDIRNAGAEFLLGPALVLRASWVQSRLLRTIEDVGALVGGNKEFFFANPGDEGARVTPTSGLTAPFPTPRAVRTYEAGELQLTKRFGTWFGSASYVHSRLFGNYAGLANSDEIRTGADGMGIYSGAQEALGQNARPGGNANRAWDMDEVMWDSRGNLDPQGRLATDRPHAIKVFGSKSLRWSDRQASDIGGLFYAASGTPLTTVVNTLNGNLVMVNGRGDMGRTPFLNYTNLVVGHEFAFGEVKRLRLEFNANNLFNQKTARNAWTQYNRAVQSAAIDLRGTDLAKGYNYQAMVAATPDAARNLATSPLYGLPDLFQPGFAGRLLLKFLF